MTDMVRGAVFQGNTFVKFVSGTPEQINLNQVNGANDWRLVETNIETAAQVPIRTSLQRSSAYRVPE